MGLTPDLSHVRNAVVDHRDCNPQLNCARGVRHRSDGVQAARNLGLGSAREHDLFCFHHCPSPGVSGSSLQLRGAGQKQVWVAGWLLIYWILSAVWAISWAVMIISGLLAAGGIAAAGGPKTRRQLQVWAGWRRSSWAFCRLLHFVVVVPRSREDSRASIWSVVTWRGSASGVVPAGSAGIIATATRSGIGSFTAGLVKCVC